MKILYLSISLPDLTVSNLFCDLINEFNIKGHEVYVIAPTRNENNTFKTTENGINIVRVKTNKFSGVSNVKKAFAYQKVVFQYIKAAKKYYWNIDFDFIISHSLPPELGLIVKRFKWHYKCPFYLMLTDFTWQDAVGFNFFSKRSPICWYYRSLEKLLYKNSDLIGCPSIGNIEFLLKQNNKLDAEKLHRLFLSQQPIEIPSVLEQNKVRKELGLEDKFVVVYGGSMGVAQKIEHVLDLAEECLSYEDIVFLLIGRGTDFAIIKEDAKNRKLINIAFKDFMPQNQYLNLLASCDTGLIVLNEKLSTPNFPSKSLSYFSLSIPILASIDYVTDFGKFLETSNTGLWSYSGDKAKLRDNLIKLYNTKDYRLKIAENGYKFFMSNMTSEKSVDIIISQIKELN